MTRGDLPPGVQACQAVHAAFEFAASHPAGTAEWRTASNTLALLAARDELALAWLCLDAVAAGLRVARFHEPDLAGVLTAAAFEPAAQPLLAHLPTALIQTSAARGGDEMTDDARLALVELTAERDALRAQLELQGLPSATRWLQRKVWRQARALDALNKRVVAQRFVLRTLDELGRSLTADEYRAASAKEPASA